jgi:hypothetical protein
LDFHRTSDGKMNGNDLFEISAKPMDLITKIRKLKERFGTNLKLKIVACYFPNLWFIVTVKFIKRSSDVA